MIKLIIGIAIGFLIAYFILGGNINFDKSVITDFEDINKNPEGYDGQEITIRGKFWPHDGYSIGEKTLRDENGYKIKIKLARERAMFEGEYYTAIGVFDSKENLLIEK